jgi:hypothetical protein
VARLDILKLQVVCFRANAIFELVALSASVGDLT